MCGQDLHQIGEIRGAEGTIYVFLRSELSSPATAEVPIHSDSCFHHGPYCDGLFRVIKLTESEQVLLCNNCGLRLKIPERLKTLGGLQEYLRLQR